MREVAQDLDKHYHGRRKKSQAHVKKLRDRLQKLDKRAPDHATVSKKLEQDIDEAEEKQKRRKEKHEHRQRLHSSIIGHSEVRSPFDSAPELTLVTSCGLQLIDPRSLLPKAPPRLMVIHTRPRPHRLPLLLAFTILKLGRPVGLPRCSDLHSI